MLADPPPKSACDAEFAPSACSVGLGIEFRAKAFAISRPHWPNLCGLFNGLLLTAILVLPPPWRQRLFFDFRAELERALSYLSLHVSCAARTRANLWFDDFHGMLQCGSGRILSAMFLTGRCLCPYTLRINLCFSLRAGSIFSP